MWPGTTQDQRVKGLEDAVNAHYKETREASRLRGRLTVARLRTDGGWPKLKAKGAPIRHLASFAWALAQQHLGVREAAVSQLLVRFYELISGPDMFLGADETREIAAVGLRVGVLYAQLADDALARGVKGWKVSPKLHLFQHICEWQAAEYGSPRFWWTYADEDMVGHMIECGSTCHPRTLAPTALYKWLLFSFGDE